MKPERAIGLWRFFVNYWDDHVMWQQSDRVFINARTMRVLQVMFGRSVVQAYLAFWLKENTIILLGDLGQLHPEAPYIELLNYVSEPPTASADA